MQHSQPRHARARTVVLVLLASTVSTTILSVRAQTPVADSSSAAQIITDATIDYSHGERHIYEYYGSDGVSRAGDGLGEHRIVGHWKVRPDGTVCFLHDDPNQSGCVFIRANGERIEFRRVDGVVEGPFKLARGNPHNL